MTSARSIRVRGVVQGVGFRPFVCRLARANSLGGWVRNSDDGVEIYIEGAKGGLEDFVQELKSEPPSAAHIAEIEVRPAELTGLTDFTIRASDAHHNPTAEISPDLPVCEDCL